MEEHFRMFLRNNLLTYEHKEVWSFIWRIASYGRTFFRMRIISSSPTSLSPTLSQTKNPYVFYPKTTLNYIILADKRWGEIQSTNLEQTQQMHQKASPTSDNGGRKKMLGAQEKKRELEREEEKKWRRKNIKHPKNIF